MMGEIHDVSIPYEAGQRTKHAAIENPDTSPGQVSIPYEAGQRTKHPGTALLTPTKAQAWFQSPTKRGNELN